MVGVNTESGEEFFFPVALTSSLVFSRNQLAWCIFYDVDKSFRKREFFLAFPRLVETVIAIFRCYHCYDPEI